MGCNCKKKREIIAKYNGSSDNVSKKNIIVRILEKILTFCFGIFVGLLFIIMAVPIVIYVLICIIFGKQPTLRIKNLNRYISNG